VKTIPMHRLVFFGLVAYSVILVLITGDTGFQADDWWILSVPYWNSFPRSIWQYTIEFRRPLEGLPWLVSYPLVGFNRIFFNLVAYLLLAGTTLLMGACLTRAFPRRRAFVAATMLFWFFFPTVCPLLYVFHMDNIWICTLLFWGAVLSFQVWAEKGAHRSSLILPVLLYYLSTLAYDASNLLLFLVPLFVFPCRQRNRHGISEPAFWLRLCAGMACGFVALLVTRFLLFHGGAIALHSSIPDFKLVREYLVKLVPYLVAPFQFVPVDAWAIGAGCLVMVFAAALLFPDPGPGLSEKDGLKTAARSDAFPMLLWAAGLILLGTFPYLMAGYSASVGFHGESRVYSTASFGLAILLGCATTVWSRRRALFVAKLAAVIALGFMAMFHVDLRRSWQEAEKINCNLWASLTRQVPDVAPGTSFLFLDLQSYVSNRAIIFGGVNGLSEFIRIFYHRKDIDAHYLYPYGDSVVTSKSTTASVSAKGIVARGVLPTEPIALDKLLIAKRVGDRLVLLDKISAADKLAAMRWEGVTQIRSNRSLILPPGRSGVPFRGVCCSWCGW
jgi:hypothetical protein